MSQDKLSKGVSNDTPTVASKGAASEGTGTPSVGVPAAVGVLLANVARAEAFRKTFATAIATLYAGLRELPKRDTAPRASVSEPRKASAAQYAELLRERPDITSMATPDAIEAGLALDAALTLVKQDFEQTFSTLVTCGRQAAFGACTGAAAVRSAARILAQDDTVLAARIATIDVPLRRGKLVSSTANAADAAAKVQQRASMRMARSAAKAAKTARRAARAAEAFADNHPLEADGVIVPAETVPKK